MDLREAHNKYNALEARHTALNHLRINIAIILAIIDGNINEAERTALIKEFPYFEKREVFFSNSHNIFDSLEFCCKRILNFSDNNRQATDIFFVKLFKIAIADGDLQPKEIEVIERIAKYLDINDKTIFAVMQTYFARYKLGGNTPNKNDLKKTMMNLHPDKFFCLEMMNANLKNQIIELANQRLKSFNEYYQERFA